MSTSHTQTHAIPRTVGAHWLKLNADIHSPVRTRIIANVYRESRRVGLIRWYTRNKHAVQTNWCRFELTLAQMSCVCPVPVSVWVHTQVYLCKMISEPSGTMSNICKRSSHVAKWMGGNSSHTCLLCAQRSLGMFAFLWLCVPSARQKKTH